MVKSLSPRALSARPFVRNFLTMLGGSAMAKVITLAAAPVISRIFAPEVFGLAAIFTALIFLLTTVATLRYDQAIIVVREDAEARAIVRLTLGQFFYSSVVVSNSQIDVDDGLPFQGENKELRLLL